MGYSQLTVPSGNLYLDTSRLTNAVNCVAMKFTDFSDNKQCWCLQKVLLTLLSGVVTVSERLSMSIRIRDKENVLLKGSLLKVGMKRCVVITL